MDTTVSARLAGTGTNHGLAKRRRPRVGFVAMVALATSFLAFNARPGSGADASGTTVTPAAPGRFEPVIEGEGYEIVDARPASSVDRRQELERTSSVVDDAAPDDDDRDGLTWFVDDEFSLTGWLFGHHGATKAVADMPAICPDPCDCPTWIGQIDALMLWMGNIPSRPLYLDSLTGATALDANQLAPPLSAAPRYAVIYNRDQCRSIEVNYFSIWGFDAQRQVGPFLDDVGNGALEMNELAGLNFNNIAAVRAESSAHIQSLEVNLRKVEWEWIRWITGFRWVEWGQDMQLLDAVVEDGVVSGGDLLDVATLNNLYGWQWGADAMLWNNGGRVRVNGIGKAGVYYNHQALQRTSYDNFIDPPTVVAADKDTVSFFGEAGVTASVAITNWLSWRAGYTLFWINGVATPANQLANTVVDPAQVPRATISPYGGAFLHGVNTGLEARW
jgi:hypothetical protein